VVSDGANYQTQGWLGGTVGTPNLVATGGTINAVTIGGTTPAAGTFNSLTNTAGTTSLAGMTATTGAFSGISTFTNSAAVTLGSTSTGALQVTVGGASVAGGLYVSGASSFGNNVGIGQNNPQYGLDISGTLRYQAVSAGANTVVWGTGRNSDYHYHNYYTYPGTSDGYTLFGHYAYSSLVAANTGVGSYQFAKEGSGTDNKVYFNIATHNGTSLAERLRVTSAGNIGVGNTTPQYKLDVGIVSGSPQSATAGAGGAIRNASPADSSPYTQARITIYGDTSVDTGNWAYLAYGSDAVARFVYAKTGSTNGQLSFGTSSATNGTGTYTEQLRMNNSGVMTRPNQPSFQSYVVSGSAPWNAGLTGNITYNATAYSDPAGGMNNATGRYTAQVAGRYFFSFIAFTNSDTGFPAYTQLFVNGGGSSPRSYQQTGSGYTPICTLATVVNLAVGDYVNINCGGGNLHQNANCYFSGFLI
jgi:hypothetical protein